MIPFNQPVHLGTELDALAKAIAVNGHVAGGGPYGKQCERLLERVVGRPTLLTTSGTHALEMCALLLRIEAGDEVIIPSFTFVSTATAFALRGARLRFADCDADGNLDPGEVERLRTAKTRAVVAVHYAGNSCDLDALQAQLGAIPLVEDAAQAIGASFNGRALGTFGVCSALSFHETKNVGCGEGGAVICGDPALVDRAEILRNKGTNRRQFLEGLVDKYTWVDIGSSYVLSDLNAAYLYVQLAELEKIQARRKLLHMRYTRELSAALEKIGARIISPRAQVTSNHHLFGIVFPNPSQRVRFIAAMREHQIVTPFHYVALHLSPFGAAIHDGRTLPHSEQLSSSLVRLPLYFNLSDDQQSEVIARTKQTIASL